MIAPTRYSHVAVAKKLPSCPTGLTMPLQR
jgi:hypothetical protein